VTALYVAIGIEADERVTESVRLAGNRGISLVEVSRAELDRMTGGLPNQGLAAQVPPFRYVDLPDVLAVADEASAPALLVAVDGVTDPRNLGALIRSAVAFGAHGLVVPARRAAGVTAAAWRTSAGTAARLPVAQVTNLVRALRDAKQAGLFVVGLDARGTTSLDDLEMADQPLLVVVGSEGSGLSRLVGETCDLTRSRADGWAGRVTQCLGCGRSDPRGNRPHASRRPGRSANRSGWPVRVIRPAVSYGAGRDAGRGRGRGRAVEHVRGRPTEARAGVRVEHVFLTLPDLDVDDVVDAWRHPAVEPHDVLLLVDLGIAGQLAVDVGVGAKLLDQVHLELQP
jgi:tRNA G18 (ribose-2'-O)-methylase SpoU